MSRENDNETILQTAGKNLLNLQTNSSLAKLLQPIRSQAFFVIFTK